MYSYCYEVIWTMATYKIQSPLKQICPVVELRNEHYGPDHVQITKVNCRLNVNCMNICTKIFYNLTQRCQDAEIQSKSCTHEYFNLLKFQPPSSSVSKVENRYNSLSAYNSLLSFVHVPALSSFDETLSYKLILIHF